MSKQRLGGSHLISSSKRQKIEEPFDKESEEIDDKSFICGEIDKLPDTVLVLIFEMLSAKDRICIMKVCKRWNRLSKCAWSKFNSFSFKEDDLRNFLLNSSQFDNATKLFSLCGKWLKFVSVDKNPIRYNLLSLFSMYCPNLEIVDFNGATLSKHISFLEPFSFQCNKLKSVSFDDCFPDVNIDDELCKFFANCPNLSSLKLCKNSTLTGNCFGNLTSNLKELNLSRCWGLKNEGLRIMADRCCNLEVLNFNFCPKITTMTFRLVCQKLTQLQQIHLVHNAWVNDEALDTISSACQNLRTLNLFLCTNISDVGLIKIAGLQYLNDLNLGFTNVTDIGVTMLAHQLCHLEKLDLTECNHVTDQSVVEIAESCQDLREIDLSLHKWLSPDVTVASILAFYNNANKRNTVLNLNVILYGNSSIAEVKKLKHPLLAFHFKSPGSLRKKYHEF